MGRGYTQAGPVPSNQNTAASFTIGGSKPTITLFAQAGAGPVSRIAASNTDHGSRGPNVPFGVEAAMPHKFHLGQSVQYSGAPFGDRAGDLEFTIVGHLPEASYRIKAADEPNERVARERELKSAELNGS